LREALKRQDVLQRNLDLKRNQNQRMNQSSKEADARAKALREWRYVRRLKQIKDPNGLYINKNDYNMRKQETNELYEFLHALFCFSFH
jgi:uncharacterized Zn finger protein